LLVAVAVDAQGPRFDARLSIPAEIDARNFGRGAAMSGDLALVTASDDGVNGGPMIVLAYLRSASGWELESALEPPGASGALTIAVDGNRAVIGDFYAGAAWAYSRTADGWRYEQELSPEQGVFTASFGSAVDLAGDRILVGAPFQASPEAGAAYMFRRGENSWELEKELVPGGTPSVNFGTAVALSNDRALVTHAGAFMPNGVYVFVRDGTAWHEETKLLGPDALGGDQFGRSLSISGDWAAIAAHYDDSQKGAVYVYARTTAGWVLEKKLRALGPKSDLHFGWTVEISGDRIVVGTSTNAAYVFARGPSGWFQEARLIAPDVLEGRQTFFGTALGVSRDRAVIGAELVDDGHGAAYTYVLRSLEPIAGNDLLVHGGRFRVSAHWTTATGAGTGTGVALTDQSGYFWFFDPSNSEISVKVIDACATPFHNFWVFASGQTDVGVVLDVRDMTTGALRTYVNPQNTPFAPIQDTAAFSSCPPS
jgi:hypothetical protein